jgi:hypothetical protein
MVLRRLCRHRYIQSQANQAVNNLGLPIIPSVRTGVTILSKKKGVELGVSSQLEKQTKRDKENLERRQTLKRHLRLTVSLD